MQFRDRADAGKQLAKRLIIYKNTNSIILALPRGGVPVAFEIAKALHLPMSVIIARKIGAPGNPEFGIGAISENAVSVLDEKSINSLQITDEKLVQLIRHEAGELKRRIDMYRDGKSLPDVSGKNTILIDDGLATGVTAQAAIGALRKFGPQKIIFASPICSPDNIKKIKTMADKIICLHCDPALRAIGAYYKNFDQINDEEVLYYLHASGQNP